MNNTSPIQQAIHQFIGYVHASRGFDILSLCEAMGLEKEEFEEGYSLIK